LATDQPLAGRGIVVTRPRELAGALAAAIEEAGGTAILFPTIAIEDVPPPDALRHLDSYDLAVFVSPTAAQKVMAHVPQWLPGPPLPPRGRDIRSSLFVGVYRFFERKSQAVDRAPQRAEGRGCRQRGTQLRQRRIRVGRDQAR